MRELDGGASIADCLLFRLPKEIRMTIYASLLQADTPIQWPGEHNASGLTPALLRTCHAIRKEATPILYENNTLAFLHPSDCNMFGWAHSPSYAKLISSIALNVRDKDVQSIWSGYLSSTQDFRSLQADFPCLRNVHVTFKSSFWAQMGGNAEYKYQHWVNDEKMRDLNLALKEVRDSMEVTVRITVVHRVPPQDVLYLKEHQPTGTEPNQRPQEFRTREYNYTGTWFSLVLLPTAPI